MGMTQHMQDEQHEQQQESQNRNRPATDANCEPSSNGTRGAGQRMNDGPASNLFDLQSYGHNGSSEHNGLSAWSGNRQQPADINTLLNPSNPPNNPFQLDSYSSAPRRPSNLRNEYIPNSAAGSGFPTFNPAMGYQRTSPRHYQKGGYPTPMTSVGFQFEESNMRTPTQSSFIHPQQMNLAYPDSQLYSSNHGLALDGMQFPFHPESGPDQTQGQVTQADTPATMDECSILGSRTKAVDKSSSSRPTRRFKREVTPVSSPHRGRELRGTARRSTAPSHAVADKCSFVLTKPDELYVMELMNAMMDDHEAEDNQGMINTWSKIKGTKGTRVKAKAVEMLDLIKLAQSQPLGDKKAVHQYNNFEHRFKQTVIALRTQKTVCKHLMEAPYSHVVANDPTYAAQVSHKLQSPVAD